MSSLREQDILVEQFVASFEKLDYMAANSEEFVDDISVGWELAVGEADDFGYKKWRPLKAATDRSFLDPLYSKLPGRFPPLFERLILSYRWAEVELHSFTLLANPPGPGLSRLFQEISSDPGLWESLIPAGYIRFAKGPDLDYDPVCFDVKSRHKNGDCPVVKIDHEEILCNDRVEVVAEVAPSFEALVRQTIAYAKKR